MKKMMGLFAVAISAIAADLKLAWDASPDVTGYRVYQSVGTNDFASIGQAQTNVFVVTNVAPGITNRFFVTATNLGGLESPPSNIAGGTIPFAPTNLTVSGIITLTIPLR